MRFPALRLLHPVTWLPDPFRRRAAITRSGTTFDRPTSKLGHHTAVSRLQHHAFACTLILARPLQIDFPTTTISSTAVISWATCNDLRAGRLWYPLEPQPTFARPTADSTSIAMVKSAVDLRSTVANLVMY